MVPNGWTKFPLSELTKEKISYGIVQAGPHVENGIPYIKSSNVGGDIDILTLQKTAPEIHHKYRRSAVHPNDIVFSLRGNIGRTSIVPIELPEANLTQGTARISVNNQNDTKFVYYQLASKKVLNRINALSKGSTFKEISLEELRKVTLIQPPLQEQRKIAQILSTWDKTIATTEKLIDASKQQKKALMQQLLTGKKRLIDPETGKAFEGEWEEVELGKITSIYDGTHSTPKYVEKGIPFYSVEHLTRDEFSNTKFITEEVFKKENKRVKLERDDILMTRIGDIGTAKHLNWDVCASFYVSLALIKANKSKFNSAYMGYYINSHEFHRELYKRTIHVAFPKKINLGEINHCKVLLPSISEQQKIAFVLTAADKEIELLAAKLAHFKQEKKALMQQLLTGKRRVSLSS
ncbi:restriction endonuclease subunit S [Vibrio parahaemolyticus]|nr:restriction endonuclease subunit S [Vibrio parahaemolyticus]HCG7625235.1 restriction endonuclease subunit S [Vibrio parahaemolyticus]HCG7629792.1 restriction endonuclease subunit S [Vibrio parahaemolyticus]